MSAAFAALTANSAPAPASTVTTNFLMGSSVRYCPKTKKPAAHFRSRKSELVPRRRPRCARRHRAAAWGRRGLLCHAFPMSNSTDGISNASLSRQPDRKFHSPRGDCTGDLEQRVACKVRQMRRTRQNDRALPQDVVFTRRSNYNRPD